MPINAPQNALTAIPDKRRAPMDIRPCILARFITIFTVTTDPAKATQGITNSFNGIYCMSIGFRTTKNRTTALAAPALIPMKDGSTNGFLKIPCIHEPVTANNAPKIVAIPAITGNKDIVDGVHSQK